MRFLPHIALPVVVLLMAAGCATSRPYGSDRAVNDFAQRAEAAGMSADTTQAAARLINLKCIRCHKFYDPNKYTPAEWEMWTRKMINKAKLTPEDADTIFNFLNAGRTNKPAA